MCYVDKNSTYYLYFIEEGAVTYSELKSTLLAKTFVFY